MESQMKKLVLVLTVAMSLVAFTACKEKFPTPGDSFKAWMTAIEKCDVAGIKGGLTAESVEQLTQISEQLKNFAQKPEGQAEDFDIFKEMCKGFSKAGGMEVISETVSPDNKDEARVVYKTNGKENSAPMVRTEKGWAIDMARMMKEAMQAQMEKMKAMAPPPAPEGAPAAEGAAPAPEAAPAAEGAAPAPEAAPAAEAPAPAPAAEAAPATQN